MAGPPATASSAQRPHLALEQPASSPTRAGARHVDAHGWLKRLQLVITSRGRELPWSQPVSAAIESSFRIGELARRVGATARTVRYYEERGLLPERGRPAGAHRLYDAEDEA